MKLVNIIFIFGIVCLSYRTMNLKNRQNDDLVFPADVQKSKEEQEKALEQTAAARLLLHQPNQLAQGQLKIAAANMHKFLKTLSKEDFENKYFNRVSNGAVAQDATYNDILETINSIAKGNNSHGYEYATLFSLFGDIGTSLMDYQINDSNLSDKDKEKNNAYKKIFEAMSKFIFFKFPPSVANQKLNELSKALLKERGGSALAPDKKKERSFINPPADNSERSGVFNLGPKADRLDKIPPRLRLPPASWPWQTLKKSLITNCKNEPWAGHLSGSIVELLYIFDIMIWKEDLNNLDANPEVSFSFTKLKYNKLKSETRQARASLAGAFLIAMGYHTALEVSVTIKGYLGEVDVPTIKNVCKYEATKYMDDLMGKFTAK